jgi:fumarate reductase subunit C
MKTYTRPMAGWWKRNPFYLWYMLREASCLFITAYALMLLWGLWRLQQGKIQYEGWRESLSSPLSLAFHAVALVLVVYHSWTWFKIMPKTLPRIPVPDWLVVTGGVTGVLACTALILLLV